MKDKSLGELFIEENGPAFTSSWKIMQNSEKRNFEFQQKKIFVIFSPV